MPCAKPCVQLAQLNYPGGAFAQAQDAAPPSPQSVLAATAVAAAVDAVPAAIGSAAATGNELGQPLAPEPQAPPPQQPPVPAAAPAEHETAAFAAAASAARFSFPTFCCRSDRNASSGAPEL